MCDEYKSLQKCNFKGRHKILCRLEVLLCFIIYESRDFEFVDIISIL